MFKKIAVIGLGYIGLPTAAILASRKLEVVGVDISSTVVKTINQGQTHFVEPDLDMIVHSSVSEGYLRASIAPESADVFVIAVPTPLKEDKQPDLSYIHAAADTIASVLEQGNLVILESTSPVGTTEQLIDWLATLRPDLTFPLKHGELSDIRVAYCPERVLPGHILRELVQNDRVIGGITPKCSESATALYQLFVEGECIKTTTRTAEMCKLTENSYRDVNIAFANELSMVCDKLDIDVRELICLANRHPRVNILKPGPGVGGHCIAVDPWFIVCNAPEDARLIKVARQVNDDKPDWVVKKVQEQIDWLLQQYPEKTSGDISITCLGLSFKPDTDDLRCSPAVQIVATLGEVHTGPLHVVEPHICTLPTALVNFANLKDINTALLETDIFLILVKHKVFRAVIDNISKDEYRVIDVCAD